jgi:hypothetical protein
VVEVAVTVEISPSLLVLVAPVEVVLADLVLT